MKFSPDLMVGVPLTQAITLLVFVVRGIVITLATFVVVDIAEVVM